MHLTINEIVLRPAVTGWLQRDLHRDRLNGEKEEEGRGAAGSSAVGAALVRPAADAWCHAARADCEQMQMFLPRHQTKKSRGLELLCLLVSMAKGGFRETVR